jgi:hypothetical protein
MCIGFSPPPPLLPPPPPPPPPVEASRASRSFLLAIRAAMVCWETYTCTSSRLTSNIHDSGLPAEAAVVAGAEPEGTALGQLAAQSPLKLGTAGGNEEKEQEEEEEEVDDESGGGGVLVVIAFRDVSAIDGRGVVDERCCPRDENQFRWSHCYLRLSRTCNGSYLLRAGRLSSPSSASIPRCCSLFHRCSARQSPYPIHSG